MSAPTARMTLAGTFLIGLTAILPLALTVAVVVWVAEMLHRFLGPQSPAGGFLVAIGIPFAQSVLTAYVLGALLVLAAIFLLGLVLQQGLRKGFRRVLDGLMGRVPVVGRIYNLSGKLVEMIDRKDNPALQSMMPAWCFFGGDGGTAVLALLPSPETVLLGGHEYLGVLIPTAPVPFGGGLLYVPAEWVKPAEIGVEGLTSVYVSMGVTVPSGLKTAQ